MSSGNARKIKPSRLRPRSPGKELTSKIIESVLRASVLAGFTASALLIPNSPIALEKPVKFFLGRLDQKEKERQIRRVITEMKRQKIVKGSYEHGLEITSKGRERLVKLDYDKLEISKPPSWDKKWRIVLFDIPFNKDEKRRDLSEKLKLTGFKLLQLSVWVHPYPCRDELNKICEHLGVAKYVTLIETAHIDHEELLKKCFKNLKLQ